MRVVIADDALVVRSGVQALLMDTGVEVVGEAADGATLTRLVAVTRPDAAIVDIRMPPGYSDEGLVAARRIRENYPSVAVLVLSQFVESSYAARLLTESPSSVGYLLKDRISDVDVLTDALTRVVAGDCVVDPAIVDRLLRQARVPSPLDKLTARETDVLRLMAEGRSNHSICDQLTLGTKTVETHVGRIFAKLGIDASAADHRRVLAVLTYLRRGPTPTQDPG
jgi:DNA-binding NarL/FixJ family response regulator